MTAAFKVDPAGKLGPASKVRPSPRLPVAFREAGGMKDLAGGFAWDISPEDPERFVGAVGGGSGGLSRPISGVESLAGLALGGRANGFALRPKSANERSAPVKSAVVGPRSGPATRGSIGVAL